MSNIINKVKDAIQGDRHETHNTSTNAGPHSTNTANKADPRVDSDLDGSRNAGAHRQDNAAGAYGGGYGSTTAGPHDSNTANRMDPRVDSDRDGSRTAGGAGYGGESFAQKHSSNYPSTNAGPHDSNLANKLDPRVDSDRDGSRTTQGGGAADYNNQSFTQKHSTEYPSTNAGPHNSNLANKLDPRVDSDRDGSRTTRGAGAADYNNQSFAQKHSTEYPSTNAGPHNANIANTLDPRVDSDRDGSLAYGSTTGTGFNDNRALGSGHGNVQRDTAGPHNSNMLNKLDPRVDSDRDGSTNLGGENRRY